jgi:hypothetical protein
VDDETYRKARIRAAELDTSVSALVARFLTELATGETDAERLKRVGLVRTWFRFKVQEITLPEPSNETHPF